MTPLFNAVQAALTKRSVPVLSPPQRLPIPDCPPTHVRGQAAAAKILGVSPRTFWTMMRRGELERAVIRHGRQVAEFDVRELQAMRKEREQEAKARIERASIPRIPKVRLGSETHAWVRIVAAASVPVTLQHVNISTGLVFDPKALASAARGLELRQVLVSQVVERHAGLGRARIKAYTAGPKFEEVRAKYAVRNSANFRRT